MGSHNFKWGEKYRPYCKMAFEQSLGGGEGISLEGIWKKRPCNGHFAIVFEEQQVVVVQGERVKWKVEKR